MSLALERPDIALLYLMGACRYRPFYKPQRKGGTLADRKCDCGQPAVARASNGFICARCQALEKIEWHEEHEHKFYDADEWQEATDKRREYARNYNQNKRHAAKTHKKG